LDCKHKGKKDYVVRPQGVFMVCGKCHEVLGKCTKFEQVERENLFEQIDKPGVVEK